MRRSAGARQHTAAAAPTAIVRRRRWWDVWGGEEGRGLARGRRTAPRGSSSHARMGAPRRAARGGGRAAVRGGAMGEVRRTVASKLAYVDRVKEFVTPSLLDGGGSTLTVDGRSYTCRRLPEPVSRHRVERQPEDAGNGGLGADVAGVVAFDVKVPNIRRAMARRGSRPCFLRRWGHHTRWGSCRLRHVVVGAPAARPGRRATQPRASKAATGSGRAWRPVRWPRRIRERDGGGGRRRVPAAGFRRRRGKAPPG